MSLCNCTLDDGRRALLLGTDKVGYLIVHTVLVDGKQERHFRVKADPISKYSDGVFNKMCFHKTEDNLEVEWVS